jgi:cytochrome c-type biogenesis protein CcmH/NrfG
MVLLQMPSRLTNMLVDASPAERFWTVWQLFGLYIAKTFWPRVLCMDYAYKTFSLASSPANVHVIIGIVSLAILAIASIAWWRRGHRALAIAAPALLLAYFPMSNTVFIRILFAERVWYLPSAFLAIILGGLVSAWAVNRRRLDILTIVVLLATIAGLWRTWERNAEWHDNGTLFASGYRDHPNSAQILTCYGRWLVDQGDLQNGLALLNACVKIAPEMVEAFVTIGQTYAQLGDYPRAISALQTASMKKPNDPDIQQTLSEVSSRLAAAEKTRLDQLKQRCDNQPASLPFFLEWTNALVDVGRTTEALSLFTSKESQFGDNADFQRARAVALMLAGKQDDAIETYRKAATLDPKSVEMLVEFATALLDRHRPEDVRQAGDLIDRAAALAPEHPRVLLIRAEWHEMHGQHDQAVRLYRQLLSSLPPGPLRNTIKARLDMTK